MPDNSSESMLAYYVIFTRLPLAHRFVPLADIGAGVLNNTYCNNNKNNLIEKVGLNDNNNDDYDNKIEQLQ